MSTWSTCIECGKTGPDVEPRWPGHGSKCFMRCEACGEARLERERSASERYPYHQPSDFDELDAGENWEDS